MLNSEKIDRCKAGLIESYMKYSIVPKAVETFDYNDDLHSNLDFANLGIWTYIPKEWFTRADIAPDLFFEEIGRDIAIGEEKHLLKRILEDTRIRRRELDEITYNKIIAKLLELGDIANTVLFIPIDYFVKLHTEWTEEVGRLVVSMNKLYVGSHQLDIFWSNKYVEFDVFIIARKSFGRWIAKPSIDSRLSVEIAESAEREERMELKVQTTFHYDVLNPERVLILTPPRNDK